MSGDHGLIIDGVNYAEPRHGTAIKDGDERQESAYIEPRGVLLEMQHYLERKGLQQVRLDRWCWPGQTGNGQFAVELRSVLGEVRIAVLRPQWAPINIDIRSMGHINSAKKRLNNYLRESVGERWIKGKGWVKV